MISPFIVTHQESAHRDANTACWL